MRYGSSSSAVPSVRMANEALHLGFGALPFIPTFTSARLPRLETKLSPLGAVCETGAACSGLGCY